MGMAKNLEERTVDFKGIVENSPNAVIEIRGSVIEYLNPTAARRFPELAVGTSIEEVLRAHKRDWGRVCEQLKGVEGDTPVLYSAKYSGKTYDFLVMRASDEPTSSEGVIYRVYGTDVTHHDKRFQRLQRQAGVDGLTGLHNRGYYGKALKRKIYDSKKTGCGLSIVAFDIDNFKQINDTWGHQFADGILQQIAERIRETMRIDDIAARYGGMNLSF